VALIATKDWPIVVAAFTWDNKDQRWTADNEGERTLGKLAEAIVRQWSPEGLDAGAFAWENPLEASPPARP
jgi:beta-lactamase class A